MFSVPENASPDVSHFTPGKVKGGRPRLPEVKRRTIRIGVNLNEAEYHALLSRVERTGMSPGVYLREAGLGAKLGLKVNDQIYHELSRIGVNVNQLARTANQLGRLPEARALQAILSAVLELRSRL